MAASRAQAIRRFIAGLGCDYGCERSFKLQPGRLYRDRILFSFEAGALGGEPLSGLAPLLEALAFPEEAREALAERLEGASLLHLGLEEDVAAGDLCKLYCEYPQQCWVREPSGWRVHRALKWRPGAGGLCAEGFYRHIDGLDYAALRARTGALAPGLAAPLQVLLQRLEQQGVPAETLFYQEVEEQGNPRYSFDLKLYALNWPLSMLQEALQGLCRQWHVPALHWHSLWAAIRQQPLGHLTAGMARDGQPFVTLYYAGAWYRRATVTTRACTAGAHRSGLDAQAAQRAVNQGER